MFVHHLATILLMCFSWLAGVFRLGCLVLVVHDCADVFLEAAKVAKYADYHATCTAIFCFFTVVWVVTRLGIFPFWIIKHTLTDAMKIVPDFPAYYTFNGLLLLLLALHCFWTYLILKVVAKVLGEGQVEGDQIEVKKAPHNAALEKTYSVSKKWKLDRVRGLAKQLDVSAEEVESWLKLRSAQDRPSVLTKFCESFWRCCYYTLACTAEVLILWNKPWFWDLDQCWTNFRDQTIARDVWWHIMISMSFYLSELMGLYFDVKRKDFWPMFTHHVISILLLFFAWKCNFNRITMAGIFLLDCNDILLESCQLLEHENQKPQLLAYKIQIQDSTGHVSK
ncbi:hypothetical protein GEV33_001653 [Tenebrio molitor]|uniref:TLC domain-containing protein n=1 Tax=Tenebrio molitor TaxID=7067 RepID=A0A8J6LJD2_TENMO|nr:hypothetical protein GEV33_001653 [Tenebrio molitor]